MYFKLSNFLELIAGILVPSAVFLFVYSLIIFSILYPGLYLMNGYKGDVCKKLNIVSRGNEILNFGSILKKRYCIPSF